MNPGFNADARRAGFSACGRRIPVTLQGSFAYTISEPPTVAIGTGIGPENSDGMRVLTIAITAPQQVHKMGARSLNQAVA
jgi:hypothetical protein